MKFLILGASGNVGRAILKSALEHEHQVTAYIRDPGRLQDVMDNNLFITKGDATNVEELREPCLSADVVINCVGPRTEEDSKNHLCTKVTQAVMNLNPKKYISITKSFVSLETDKKRGFSDSIFTKNSIKKLSSEYEDRQLEMNTLLHSLNKNWTLLRIKELEVSNSGNIFVSNKEFKGSNVKSKPLGEWIIKEATTHAFNGQVVFAWSEK